MKRTTEARCPDCRSNHVQRIGGAEIFDAPHTGATPSMEVWFSDACERGFIKLPPVHVARTGETALA
jgi:hypothetical protein